MTCYWDSIRDSLTLDDYNRLDFNHKPNLQQFISTLKTKNTLVNNVLWQGNGFRNQEISEHFEAVKSYNTNDIHNGHLTSICDSFILLLCELLEISIEHKYLNNVIYYKNKKHSRKTLHFKSNNGHFEIDHYKNQEKQRKILQMRQSSQPHVQQPYVQQPHVQQPHVSQPHVQQPHYMNINNGIGLNFSLFKN